MKKKEFLTEAKRKAIISEKEKAIIESFAKTFNKIKRIDENEVPTMDVKTAEKQAFEFANSPEMGAFVNKILANAKPEDIEQLKRTLGSVSEGMMSENDFSSFLDIAHKAQSALNENNGVSDLQNSIGKALSTFGAVNIMSMGMLPALVGMAVDYFAGTNFLQMAGDAIGSGGVAAGLSVIGGLIGGGLIWRLGKAISGEEVTDNTPLFEEGIEGVNGQSVIPNEIFQMEEFETNDYDLVELNMGQDDSKLEMEFGYIETEQGCFYLKATVEFYINISGSYRAATHYDPEEGPEEEFGDGDVVEMKYVDCQGEQEYQLTDEMKQIAIPNILAEFDELREYISKKAWEGLEDGRDDEPDRDYDDRDYGREFGGEDGW